jgi:predicted negative regulator of RcsB-dependent stress response
LIFDNASQRDLNFFDIQEAKRNFFMSNTTQTPTLEQTLNRTDLGHFLYENKKIFFGALLAVVICILAFVGWKQAQEARSLDNSVKVFEFQKNIWEEAKTGKITSQDLVQKYNALPAEVQQAPVMVPVALEIGKFFYDKGAYTEANDVLSKIDTSKNSLAKFFVGMQKYVVLEKLGKTDEAIAVLEEVLKQEGGFMNALVATELGRLYLSKGEKGKAQSQFDYVINTYPNDEHAKLAKLYLAQMAK